MSLGATEPRSSLCCFPRVSGDEPASLIIARKVSFPRVSGDEPAATSRSKMSCMFSPRERG